MGTRSNHREKADHNQEFINSIDREKYPDWVVTVGFYKGLHLVEMLFAKNGRHSNNHRDRHDLLKRNYETIWREYLPLYALARRARYKVRSITKETMDYALSRLSRIEKVINELIEE